MNNEIRSTIYLEEDLYKRFREACNKKFGDKQGKIKQGYVLAITNFSNQVLQDVVDIVIEMKPEPESTAKKLEEAKIETEPEPEIIEPEPESTAKKLEEAESPVEETPQEIVEVVQVEEPRIKTPQEVIEESRSVVEPPPISATKQDEAKMISVDEGLAGLVSSIKTQEATASVKLDQDSELQTIVAKAEPTNKEVDKPEEVLEQERLAKVREDQHLSKLKTQSEFVGENSIEAKAKRLADRRRKQQEEQLKSKV